MSESKHTPGPWTVKRSPALYDGAHDYAISGDGAMVLSEAFGRGALGEWLPAEANARLIAAAPELLAAVTEAHDLIAGNLTGIEWKRACQAFVETARAAIAKAEGRS